MNFENVRNLNPLQGIYLFSAMSEETSLTKLSVDGNDLSLVPAEHLARGANRLQEVKFNHLYLCLTWTSQFAGGPLWNEVDRHANYFNFPRFTELHSTQGFRRNHCYILL